MSFYVLLGKLYMNKKNIQIIECFNLFFMFLEVTGFEPATSSLQS